MKKNKKSKNGIKQSIKDDNKNNDLVNMLESICKSLANGIEENGNTRKMDIIDYYDYCNYSLEKLLMLANTIGLDNKKIYTIYKFVMSNNGYDKTKPRDISEILREKNIINGEEIATEYKVSIIEILKDKNIPVNRKTYTLMLRRKMNEDKEAKKCIKSNN